MMHLRYHLVLRLAPGSSCLDWVKEAAFSWPSLGQLIAASAGRINTAPGTPAFGCQFSLDFRTSTLVTFPTCLLLDG